MGDTQGNEVETKHGLLTTYRRIWFFPDPKRENKTIMRLRQ